MRKERLYPENGTLSGRRQALAGNRFHHIAKPIEFADCSVEIRRNAQALELLMNYRSSKDVMCSEQVIAHCGRIQAFDLHIGNGARLLLIEGSVEANLRKILEPVHPVTRKITQAGFFPFAADSVMKKQGLANGQLGRR